MTTPTLPNFELVTDEGCAYYLCGDALMQVPLDSDDQLMWSLPGVDGNFGGAAVQFDVAFETEDERRAVEAIRDRLQAAQS